MPGLNGRALRYPRGKVLGGCSSINGMIYMRGQARDYDALGRADRRRRLVAGTTCCRTSRAREHCAHGGRPGGALPRRRRRAAGRAAARCAGHPRAFAAAAARRHPAASDFNGGDNEGVGYFEVNQRRRLALERGEGVPAPACTAAATSPCGPARRSTRLLRRGAGRGGLALHRRRAVRTASRSRARGGEVILAAGGDQLAEAPATLRHRAGRAARGHGIEVVADLPGVGGNLQDHLQIRTRLQGRGRGHAQRARQRCRQGARSASNTRSAAAGR